MSEKEKLTKKFILVGMDDAQISTSTRPIIGTDSLATCLGVLLYCESKKVAIVAHVSSEPMTALNKIFKLIVSNKLYREHFKYKIIWGTDREPALFYNVIDTLEKHFTDYTPFDDSEFNNDMVGVNEKTMSHYFAFDASLGKFVSENVLYGSDYYIVNDEYDSNDKAKYR